MNLSLHFWQCTQYPPGCPLLQVNCSTPITPHSPPRVAWREGKAVLLYDDSHLDADGRNACDPVNPIGNTLPVVVSADNAAFWLIVSYCSVYITWHINLTQSAYYPDLFLCNVCVTKLQPNPP